LSEVFRGAYPIARAGLYVGVAGPVEVTIEKLVYIRQRQFVVELRRGPLLAALLRNAYVEATAGVAFLAQAECAAHDGFILPPGLNMSAMKIVRVMQFVHHVTHVH
jgi:hypothetical protein